MMTLSPELRRVGLTVHVVTSVGWFGSVAGFLALAVAGLSSRDAQMVRAAYLAMNVTAWFVILPMAFMALLTGIIQSLGTPWGLFRHYWVLAKLSLTVIATIVLLLKMRLIDDIARAAAATTLSSADLVHPRIELVVHAAGGLLVLLLTATLAVYKPRGTIPVRNALKLARFRGYFPLGGESSTNGPKTYQGLPAGVPAEGR